MTARAPRIATWLLVRFSSGPHGEAIAGDLMEQFSARPSRAWYWRQVLSAIRADVINTAADHKGRTMLAILVGWLAYFAASFPAIWLIRVLRPTLNGWLIDGADLSFYWATLIQRTMIVTIACVAVGYLASTVSRRWAPAPAVVCFLALSVLIFEYGMMALLFSLQPGPSQSLSTTELVAPALFAISRPAGVLVGGLLAMRATSPSPS
jgi:hypothetical protein